MAKRTEIRFFPTDKQNDYLLELTELTGLSKTDLIRSLIFAQQTGGRLLPYPVDRDAYSTVAKQINQAGNNLNQAVAAAHKLMKAGKASEAEVSNLQASVDNFHTTVLAELRRLREK